MPQQPGPFDLQGRCGEPSRSSDPLWRQALVTGFEVFRPASSAALARKERRRGGRPPMDPVVMPGMLVLQALSGLSGGQVERRVRARLSFMRPLGPMLAGRVPDRTTIRLFR